MAIDLIEHPFVGTEVTHGNNKGLCTGARIGCGVVFSNKDSELRWSTIEFRIKPNTGGRAYWTKSFKHEPLNEYTANYEKQLKEIEGA